jgi:preprotein translocase subunit Sec63
MSNKPPKYDYYGLLGLDKKCAFPDIKSAYKKLALVSHTKLSLICFAIEISS